jgi:hypothetical protein
MKKAIIILVILFSVGIVSAALPDYLKASEVDEPSSTVKIGDSVSAKMTLKRVGIVPDSAKLKIVTELVDSRIEVTIDNVTENYVLKSNEIPLAAGGVEEIKIRVFGDAPEVERQIDIKVLEVTTHVEYPGEDPEDQEDGTFTTTVSDKEIKETVTTIDDAWDKYNVAKAKVDTLASTGVNTAALEAQIQNAKELLDNADELHDKGEIDLAKSTAESASKILDGVIIDAEKSGVGPVPLDLRRYLVIGGAVIVVLIVALFLKGKREELG